MVSYRLNCIIFPTIVRRFKSQDIAQLDPHQNDRNLRREDGLEMIQIDATCELELFDATTINHDMHDASPFHISRTIDRESCWIPIIPGPTKRTTVFYV